jgi:hypothetical protein
MENGGVDVRRSVFLKKASPDLGSLGVRVVVRLAISLL